MQLFNGYPLLVKTPVNTGPDSEARLRQARGVGTALLRKLPEPLNEGRKEEGRGGPAGTNSVNCLPGGNDSIDRHSWYCDLGVPVPVPSRSRLVF